jgi:hypothetical protein
MDATYPNYVRCVLECYGERYGKPMIGEKTPQHLWYVPLMLEWYPNAKVIWLLRDGRDTVVALDRLHGRGVRRTSFYWRMFARFGMKWERKYPNNLIRVRFEDLVFEPKKLLQRLCTFLGVEYEERMLDTQIESDSVIGKETAFKQVALGAIDRAKVGEYKRVMTERQRWIMASAMEPYLLRLGYPPTEVGACPLLERVKNALLSAPWRLVYHPTTVLLTERTPYKFVVGRIWNRLTGTYRGLAKTMQWQTAPPNVPVSVDSRFDLKKSPNSDSSQGTNRSDAGSQSSK